MPSTKRKPAARAKRASPWKIHRDGSRTFYTLDGGDSWEVGYMAAARGAPASLGKYGWWVDHPTLTLDDRLALQGRAKTLPAAKKAALAAMEAAQDAWIRREQHKYAQASARRRSVYGRVRAFFGLRNPRSNPPGRDGFVESVQEQFGFTPAQAHTILDVFLKHKLAKYDSVGQVRLAHGAAWSKTVMRRALAMAKDAKTA